MNEYKLTKMVIRSNAITRKLRHEHIEAWLEGKFNLEGHIRSGLGKSI